MKNYECSNEIYESGKDRTCGSAVFRGKYCAECLAHELIRAVDALADAERQVVYARAELQKLANGG